MQISKGFTSKYSELCAGEDLILANRLHQILSDHHRAI